jgi:hypothetical protein
VGNTFIHFPKIKVYLLQSWALAFTNTHDHHTERRG